MRSRQPSPTTRRSTAATTANPAPTRRRRTDMAVTLTDRAADHVRRYIEKRGKGGGVRLGVRTTGCSGLAYKLEFAHEGKPEDQAFESNRVRVLIDPQSLAYLDRTELDFLRQ